MEKIVSQLKPSYIEEIKEGLSSSCFTLNDFEIVLPKSGDVVLKVLFKHMTEYCYSLREEEKLQEVSGGIAPFNQTKSSKLVTHLYADVCPGAYKRNSTWEVSGFSKVPSQLQDWVKYIKHDLYALSPKKDPLESLRKEFEAELEGLVDDPNGYFTDNEIINIRQKFDDLYKKFDSLKEEYEISKKQLSEIKLEIEEFKNSAESYSKGMWARITNNKLTDLVVATLKTKEGRQFLLEQLKGLISN
jgi:hypothetical protein